MKIETKEDIDKLTEEFGILADMFYYEHEDKGLANWAIDNTPDLLEKVNELMQVEDDYETRRKTMERALDILKGASYREEDR